MRWIFLLLSPILLSASPKSGFDAGLGIGYRCDQISFTQSYESQLIYKEHDADLNGLVLDAYLDIIPNGWLLSSYTTGGWFLSGRAHNISAIQGMRESFHQSASGFFVDNRECLGYFVDCGKGWQICPQAGYSVDYQQLQRGTAHDAGCDLAHTHFKRLWWGPLLGGDFVVKPLCGWILETGYYYYFLHLDQTFAPFEKVNNEWIYVKSKSNDDGAHGQSIHGKIVAEISTSCRLNIRFDWLDFFAPHQKAHMIQSGHLRARWRSISTIMELEYFY